MGLYVTFHCDMELLRRYKVIMYDTLYCNIPLPIGDGKEKVFSENGFQTKSFDCLLDYYRIEEDRTLWTGQSKGGRYFTSRIITFWDWVKIKQRSYWGMWELELVGGFVNRDSIRNITLDKMSMNKKDKYDMLLCDIELPIGNKIKSFFYGHYFQTTQLGKEMKLYRLDKDGILWRLKSYDNLEWKRTKKNKEIQFWGWVIIGDKEYWGEWELVVANGQVDYNSIRNVELRWLGE